MELREFSNPEIAFLSELLTEEFDRYLHEPDRLKEDDYKALTSLSQKVQDEAKQRRLWWAL